MTREIITLGLALSLAAVSAPGPLAAQDRAAPVVRARASVGFVQSSGARIGVYLETACEAESNARGDCDEAPRVRGVVEGSPAEVAGILAGDTLLTLDGVSLSTEQGRRSLSRLRAGIPIQIEVGREAGHTTLRVIPTARARGVQVRSYGRDVEAVEAVGPVPRPEFNVFRFRSDDGEVTEFQFAPESETPPDASGWVVFSPDIAGRLQVHVGEGDAAALMVDGESVTLTELEGHLIELSENLQIGEHEFKLNIAVDEVGEAVRRHLVLENPELARRLETIRVESLAAAREQLELLVERRSELEERGEIPPQPASGVGSARSVSPRAARLRSGVVVSGVPEAVEHRMGGAEFRVLTPELAEYFETDSGLLVLRVIPGTPIATLGLRGGDVVIEVGGHKETDMSMFRHLAEATREGGVDVKWIRKGTIHTGRLAGN